MSKSCEEDRRKTHSKSVMPKRIVDLDLWKEVNEKLKGSESQKVEAVRILFKDLYSLPEESVDLIKKLTQVETSLEVRLSIVQSLREYYESIPWSLSSELIEALRKDPEERVKKVADELYRQSIKIITEPVFKYLQIYKENIARLSERLYMKFTQEQFSRISEQLKSIIHRPIPLTEFSAIHLFPAVDFINKFNTDLAKNMQQLILNYYPPRDLQILKEPYEISEKSPSFQMKRRLEECPPGIENWRRYQDICKEILTYTLVPPLLAPLKEEETEGGIQRRDLIFHIPHEVEGFWKWIMITYSSLAMIVDCKNYSKELKQNNVVITSKYFGPKRLSLFGIIVTRKGLDRNAKKIQKRMWFEDDKMVLCLNDLDLMKMLELKDRDEDPSKVIDEAVRSFRQSL